MEATKATLFILTKHWQDINNQLVITFFAYNQTHGPLRLIFTHEKCVFFIKRSQEISLSSLHYERKSVNLKSPSHEDVDAIYFKSYKEHNIAIKQLKEQRITLYESDIDPAERFLMERFIHCECEIFGNPDHTSDKLTTFVNPKIRSAYCNPDFSILSFDIETGVESNTLYSISVYTNLGEEHVFMNGEPPDNHPKFITFFEDEKQTLIGFLNWIQQTDPDIIIGWNVIGFDLRFLIEKCQEHHVQPTFGRLKEKAVLFQKANGNYGIDIPGRIVIDGPIAMKGSFLNYDFYGLDYISEKVLGEHKTIKKSNQDKIDEINRLYREDKIELARYNLKDSILVMKIFKKLELISLLIQRSKMSGMLLNQTGRSAASFDHLYLPRFHRKGFVAISLDNVVRASAAKGGYVFSPRPGIHNHIVIIDFKSLYPSIIQSFKIDPYSLIMKNSQPIQTPSGHHFSKTHYILPEIISELLKKRSEAKSQGNQPLSQAIKILMNSFYGVMGSYGCRFYHPELPRAITETGQFILKESKVFIEQKGYDVIYGDTDSLFVKLNHVEPEYIDRRGKGLVEELNQFWKERFRQEYDSESFLEAEFEKVYDKLVFTAMRHGEEGAKKRYAGYSYDVDQPIIDFVGLESVRSDWTDLAKDFQYQLYLQIFENKNVAPFIATYVDQVFEGQFDDKLIYHKRLRKQIHEYTKNVPPHVKAAQKMKQTSKDIFYVITLNGPEPTENLTAKPDYQHYVDRQLQPIADAILPFIQLSFEKIINRQLTIFD